MGHRTFAFVAGVARTLVGLLHAAISICYQFRVFARILSEAYASAL